MDGRTQLFIDRLSRIPIEAYRHVVMKFFEKEVQRYLQAPDSLPLFNATIDLMVDIVLKR